MGLVGYLAFLFYHFLLYTCTGKACENRSQLHVQFVHHCGVGCIGLNHGQSDRMTNMSCVVSLSLCVFSLSHSCTFLVVFFQIHSSDMFRSLLPQSIDDHVFVFHLSVSLSLCQPSLILFPLNLLSRSLNPPVCLALHVLVSMYRPNLIRQDCLEREGVIRAA